MATLLPEGFEDLEPYAPYALKTTAERAAQRSTTTAEERERLVQGVQGRAAAALDYLDTKPLADLDEKEQRLLDLLMAYSHVALAVKIQKDGEDAHRPMRERMRITHSPSD